MAERAGIGKGAASGHKSGMSGPRYLVAIMALSVTISHAPESAANGIVRIVGNHRWALSPGRPIP